MSRTINVTMRAVTASDRTGSRRKLAGGVFLAAMSVSLSPSLFGQALLHQLPDVGAVSMSMTADVDGDGYADLAVGTESAELLGLTGPEAVVVYSGRDGSILYLFQGPTPTWSTAFGAAVDNAGDVNADGFADIVMGAPNEGGFPGHIGVVRVRSGQDGSLLHHWFGESAVDRLGSGVAAVGDLDGDGFADVAAGAPFGTFGPFSSGNARVFSGQTGSTLLKVGGDSNDERFGQSLAGAGDVDGDGIRDFIVGAPQDDQNGQIVGSARVFSGANGALIHKFFGLLSGSAFGEQVDGAGDLDGDGFADLVVSAPSHDSNHGLVRAFSGQSGAPLYTVIGADPFSLGSALSGGGDIDGDGLGDVLVSVPDDDALATSGGTVQVRSGPAGLLTHTFVGNVWLGILGLSVDIGGDMNGDGLADFAISSWREAPESVAADGPVFVRSLAACGPVAYYGTPCVGSGGFTPVLLFQGCPLRGAQIEISVIHGKGGASALFLVGPSAGSVPLPGGCSLLVPSVAVAVAAPLTAGPNGSGSVELVASIPVNVPPLSASLQAFVVDPGVAGGLAATQGVTITIP